MYESKPGVGFWRRAVSGPGRSHSPSNMIIGHGLGTGMGMGIVSTSATL